VSHSRLQNKILQIISNFPIGAEVGDMHVAFHIPQFYDCLTKLCGQQANVIQSYENVRHIRQGEARHRKYK
jgi:hypothetical protein